MMRNSKIFPLYVFALTILLFYSCEESSSRKSEKIQESFELKMSIFSNPQFVDPLYYSNNTEKLVCNLLFQPLLSVNDSSNGITAILASDLPEIDSGLSGDIIHYTLRKDAKWTNGDPVESRDVIFTFKTFLNPHARLSYIEDYFLFVDSIVANNKHNFSIYCNNRASDNLFRSGDMEILPEHLFDSSRVLSGYSFSELKEYDPVTNVDSVLLNFGEQLQNLRILKAPFNISGTGAYIVKSFEMNQKLVLEKKENWWGDVHSQKSFFFKAGPDEIELNIYMNELTASMSFINNELDVLYGSNRESSEEVLKQNSSVSEYRKTDYALNAFVYLSVNTQHPLMKNKNVRKAIAALSDARVYVSDILKGQAEVINSFVPGENKKLYNSELEHYSSNRDSIEIWLRNAGWKKENGNWSFSGKNIRLEFLVQSGNSNSEDYAIYFKNNASKIGLEIDLVPLEFSTMIKRLRSGDYMMARLGTNTGAMFTNYRSLFHSSSIGSQNYPRMNVEKANEIIERLEREKNEVKIIELTRELQEIIYSEYSFIFLYRPTASAFIKKDILGFHKTPTSVIPWPGAFYPSDEQVFN